MELSSSSSDNWLNNMLCFGLSLFSVTHSSHLQNYLNSSASLRACFLEDLKRRQLVLDVTLESRFSVLHSEIRSLASKMNVRITLPVVRGVMITLVLEETGTRWRWKGKNLLMQKCYHLNI